MEIKKSHTFKPSTDKIVEVKKKKTDVKSDVVHDFGEMDFPPNKKDFTEEIDAPVALKDDVRESGVCGKCRKRYTAVPVIDGVPQCPRCYKL